MAEKSSSGIYSISYHQLKFLSVVGLIVVHSLSFVNKSYQISLDTLPGFALLKVFSIFSGFFIALAGVSFYQALRPWMRGGRLLNWKSSTRFVDYLFVLLLIDGLKIYLLHGSVLSAFYWDFLKTLLLALLVILLLARVHVLLVLALNLFISYFNSPIRDWAMSKLTQTNEVPVDLGLWNEAHTTCLLLLLFTLIFCFKIIYRSPLTKRLRQVFTLLLILTAFWVWQNLSARTFTFSEYLMLKNMWIYGLVGEENIAGYYPALIWLPSALSGFVVCHYAIKWQRLYEVAPIRWAAAIVVVTVLFYFACFRDTFTAHENLINFWDVKYFLKTDLLGEFFKVFYDLSIFLILVEIHRRWRGRWLSNLAVKFSICSFPIYIVCTSWSLVFANYVGQSLGFYTSATLNFLTTFLFCWLVAEVGYFFWSKKISFRIAKAV